MATNIRANILQKQRLMRLKHIRTMFFDQKKQKDGKVLTRMDYGSSLLQRLESHQCIYRNSSEVLSSLIVLDLEGLITLINDI